ncbi:MAG: hypothetical protein HQL48_01975 [Gammaproteobacteria bacterium]|nr:hypothetical protein [Gammaproteobacteria bacterium]
MTTSRFHFTPLLLLILLLLALPAAAEEVVVVVKKSAIRTKPQFFAPTIVTVDYLQRLQQESEMKGWFEVRFEGKNGWIHSSAVKSRDRHSQDQLTSVISLVSGDKEKEKRFDEDEISLAGKGFNEGVEQEYRKKSPKDDFSAVDRLEQQTASPEAIAQFAREGLLKPRNTQ